MSTWRATDAALAQDILYVAQAPAAAPAPPLQGRVVADVAIVGAGLAGLSTARALLDAGAAARGLRIVVLEAGRVGGGASGRNGGQVLSGLADEMAAAEAQLGEAGAREIWNATVHGVALVRERARRLGCDWRDGALTVATSTRKAQSLQRSTESLRRRYGYPLTWIPKADLPRWIRSEAYHAASYDAGGGHLDPYAYTRALARSVVDDGAALHEQSAVLSLDPGSQTTLRTAQGEVRARHVVLAGNVYLEGLAPSIAARIMPVGTYVGATAPIGEERMTALIPCAAAVCDTNVVLDYFRPSSDARLIFGGRVSYSTATPKGLADHLRARMVSIFPSMAQVAFEHVWGGFVDITMNRSPDFGRLYQERGASVHYLQGFSGHGLALTALAGELAGLSVLGQAQGFDRFAALRHRAFPGGPGLRTPLLVVGMAWHRLRDLF